MAANSVEPTRSAATGRDWLKFVLVQLTCLLVAAFVWLLWQLAEPISHTVVLFLLGAACAFVLAEPSSLLARRLGGNRMLGILLAYLMMFGIIIGAMLLLAVPFVSQASSFIANLPTYVSDIERQASALEAWLAAQGVQIPLQAMAAQVSGALAASFHDLLHGLVGAASSIGGIVMNGVMVLVISIYFLTSAAAMRRNTLYAVPKRFRAVHEFVRSSAARVMGGYLRGQLIMAAVIGTLAGLGTGLLGLPYFVVLGVLAGMFELIPMFGPILSAVPAVIVALFMPWPTVVWVILLFVIIQQFECNVLGPKVSGHAVGLHPLGSMFALLVGFEVAGILGGLFAVPVAGVIWVLSTAAYRSLVNLEPVTDIDQQLGRLEAVHGES
jgi:predicted PurR-regulated permease PerM